MEREEIWYRVQAGDVAIFKKYKCSMTVAVKPCEQFPVLSVSALRGWNWRLVQLLAPEKTKLLSILWAERKKAFKGNVRNPKAAKRKAS